jgi:hypothetical protein
MLRALDALDLAVFECAAPSQRFSLKRPAYSFMVAPTGTPSSSSGCGPRAARTLPMDELAELILVAQLQSM